MNTVPTIVIDTREQTPLRFINLPNEPGTLYSGDYSIQGWEHDFAIERKTVADLCQSVTRGRARFERELHRLRGFDFARLLIVGRREEVARVAQNPKAAFSSLGAFETRYKVSVVWSPSPKAAARQIEVWAWFWWRERVRRFQSVPTCPLT